MAAIPLTGVTTAYAANAASPTLTMQLAAELGVIAKALARPEIDLRSASTSTVASAGTLSKLIDTVPSTVAAAVVAEVGITLNLVKQSKGVAAPALQTGVQPKWQA